jgi:hypothetical protein
MIRFSIRRLCILPVIVAVVCALFASLPWPWAVLAIAGLNGVACIGFWIVGRRAVSGLAATTTALLIATLVQTDWGMSSPHPEVRVAWSWLVAACFGQVATVVCWLLDFKRGRGRDR